MVWYLPSSCSRSSIASGRSCLAGSTFSLEAFEGLPPSDLRTVCGGVGVGKGGRVGKNDYVGWCDSMKGCHQYCQ